jgi:hypothetical protein
MERYETVAPGAAPADRREAVPARHRALLRYGAVAVTAGVLLAGLGGVLVARAAVDPDRYLTLAVTAEPDDGDPTARGPLVLGADLSPR